MQILLLEYAHLICLSTIRVVPIHAGSDTVSRVPRSVFVNSIDPGLDIPQAVNVCILINMYSYITAITTNPVNNLKSA